MEVLLAAFKEACALLGPSWNGAISRTAGTLVPAQFNQLKPNTRTMNRTILTSSSIDAHLYLVPERPGLRRTVSTIALLAGAVLITSCGGAQNPYAKKSGDYPLDVAPTISGPLGEGFTATKAVLKISGEFFGSKLLVQIERTGEDLPLDVNDAQVCGVGAGKKYEWCLTADVFGDGDIPLATNLDKYGHEPFENSLSLREGETAWLEFSLSRSELENDPENAKLVSLSSSMEVRDTSPITTSHDSESSGSVGMSHDDQDWDEILTSYERYVDNYIKLVKKANTGDVSLVAEYAEAMESATDLQSKLQGAGVNLSASQLSRFTKLQTKLLNASSSM